MFNREIAAAVPARSAFLFGPRQVGKSTLLRSLPALMVVDLLDPEERLLYTKAPSLLAERVATLPATGTIVLDEVQRVPALLDVVQQLMARRPGLRFLMSGSSARKLRRGAANLLGGRATARWPTPRCVRTTRFSRTRWWASSCARMSRGRANV